MIYALLAIICFIIVGIINRKIKKAKQAEKDADSVNMNLSDILIFDTETTGIFPNSEEILELAIINGCGDVLYWSAIRIESSFCGVLAVKVDTGTIPVMSLLIGFVLL